MESGTPYTGSVLLMDARRYPEHVQDARRYPEHMLDSRGYPVQEHDSGRYIPFHYFPRFYDGFYDHGFNSVRNRRPDSDNLPRYVTLRELGVDNASSRDNLAVRDHDNLASRDEPRNQGMSMSQRLRQSGYKEGKRGKVQCYEMSPYTRDGENYCEIGGPGEEPLQAEKKEEKTDESSVESFSEFMQNITASFIRFIFQEGSPVLRRLFWFIIWAICCGYALFNIQTAINQYFMFETASQLSFFKTPGEPLVMPAITMCNMNKYRKSWLNNPKNEFLLNYEKERVWVKKDDGSRYVSPDDEEKAKNVLVTDLEREGKHSVSKMFFEVFFGEENLTASLQEHLTETNTELGICSTFNADGTKKVSRTGADYGATFIIYIDQSEYADTQESAGIKVMLHHYQEPPLIKEYGLAIPPGSQAYISTSTVRVNNLGMPYFNCTDRNLKDGSNYTVVGCTLECHAKILDSKCNCKQGHMPLDHISNCSLYKHETCTKPEIKKIHQGVYDAEIDTCGCVDACREITYESSLSRAQYPSTNAGEAMAEDVTVLRENYIRLHVYFQTLAIKDVQKVPAYTVMNLLGDVGGNLGLFIGANVATLGELIDYFTRLILSWARARKIA